MNAALDVPIVDGLRVEAEGQAVCLPSDDMKEAITAFVEQRAAGLPGRVILLADASAEHGGPPAGRPSARSHRRPRRTPTGRRPRPRARPRWRACRAPKSPTTFSLPDGTSRRHRRSRPSRRWSGCGSPRSGCRRRRCPGARSRSGSRPRASSRRPPHGRTRAGPAGWTATTPPRRRQGRTSPKPSSRTTDASAVREHLRAGPARRAGLGAVVGERDDGDVAPVGDGRTGAQVFGPVADVVPDPVLEYAASRSYARVWP